MAKDATKHTTPMLRPVKSLFNELCCRITGRRRIEQECEQRYRSHVKDYQRLIENLRTRLADADITHRQEMADLHASYKMQVKNLTDKLQKANADMGNYIRSQQMLERTNDALTDLAAAIAGGDTDDIIRVTEELEWSNPLTQIAHGHLNILRRRNELEHNMEKLHENFNLE